VGVAGHAFSKAEGRLLFVSEISALLEVGQIFDLLFAPA
jgi:hypothetical protein